MIDSTSDKDGEYSGDTGKLYGHPEIFLKRRVCLPLHPAYVSGRQRCTGAVYHITADGIYHSKSAGKISDWTLYTNRRKLIRVMRFAADQGLIGVTDGKDEAFMDDEGGEVLYENTGASRYFMKSFSKDIMEYTKPEDFQESDWFEVDEDRGFARRHRVYKRLIFAPGMYKEDGSSEDFEYLKYYGRRLSEELEQIFDCHVHIHKGSAYLLSGDDCRMGTVFPGNNSISDILLLCFREIRKKIEKGQWKTGLDETCLIDGIEFENMIKEMKQEYGSGFSKNYREMPEGEFVKSVLDEMEVVDVHKKRRTRSSDKNMSAHRKNTGKLSGGLYGRKK